MGCQHEVYVGDSLTFTINTHDPETAEYADADSNPTYRVYSAETATPILTGTMAKLDDLNTVGFYAETLVCSGANGFVAGTSYTIYIEAIVDSHPGTTSYNFRAISRPINIGTSSKVYTVTAGGQPVQNAYCRMTTDVAGLNNVADGRTNASGQVTFYHDLTAGTTVYIFVEAEGYTPAAYPDEEVI